MTTWTAGGPVGASDAISAATIDAIRARVPVPRVLEEHGVKLRRAGRHQTALCVFHTEKTPSMAVHAERFHCFGCQAHGDVIDLVQQLDGLEWRDAVERVALDAGIDLTPERRNAAPPPTRSSLKPLRAARDYPPQGEILDLWGTCVPVTEDDEVASWLAALRIDVQRVADGDLARALPHVDVPSFAHHARSPWPSTGHRLITPLRTPYGRIRSLKARDVTGSSPKHLKSLTAIGLCKGLAMLEPAAREAIMPSCQDLWYDDLSARRLTVVEGEKKYLLHATLASDADVAAPATIGILSGSEDVVARIPDGWTVYLAVDPDAGGARYATRIVQLLEARWRLGDVAIELRTEHVLTESLTVEMRRAC